MPAAHEARRASFPPQETFKACLHRGGLYKSDADGDPVEEPLFDLMLPNQPARDRDDVALCGVARFSM